MKKALFLVCSLIFLLACENNNQVQVETVDALPKEIVQINKKIKSQSDNAALYYQRAQLYRGIREDSLALRDLEKTISLDTTQSKYFSAIGDLLFDKKDISGSVKWFQKAISIDPNDEMAHLKIANIFLFSKEYPKAFAEINTVLRQNVYNAEAYFLKGMCYKDMGEMDRAISSFQTAVQTDPKLYDGFMQLGLIYIKRKDPLAIQYLDNAINADSFRMEAHYAKTMFYQNQEQFEEAKKVLRRAILIDHDYVVGHYNMGWIYLQQDSNAKARKEFERVIALEPDNAKAYYNKGYANELLGDTAQAISDYEQALIFEPEFELAKEALQGVKK